MQPAPLFHDLAEGPDGGSAYWVTAADGVRIRLGVWPDGERGTVLIFPGRTEYIEKYGRCAKQFSDMGFAVAAVDWRGQGLADRALPNRRIGHVDEFEDFQLDVAAVWNTIQDLDLPQPVYLVAHSMGGCIGLRALNEGLGVEKAMFSAPMWGVVFDPRILRQVAWTFSTLLHPFPSRNWLSPGTEIDAYLTVGAFEDNTLTTDRDTFEYMKKQVLAVPDFALGGPSVQWLYSALREMLHLSRLPSVDTPCVTYLGTNERIVDPKRIKQRMAKWDNGELVEIEGAEHEILMEIPATRKKFFDHADRFLRP